MALEPESDLWAQIRYAYEHTDRPIGDICVEHGISSGTLRDRMRRWQWKRRRPPISRDGPPAAVRYGQHIMAEEEMLPSVMRGHGRQAASEESIIPALRSMDSGPAPNGASRNDRKSDIDLSPHAGRGDQATEVNDPEPEADATVARLRGAVARVLPAIEATIARLAAGPQHPREMEQAGRALSALTRTLRELNALLSAHNMRTAEDDPVPEDIDDFRMEVARRIRAFIASRKQQGGEANRKET